MIGAIGTYCNGITFKFVAPGVNWSDGFSMKEFQVWMIIVIWGPLKNIIKEEKT